MFDFIREGAAQEILHGMINDTLLDLARSDIIVRLAPEAQQRLEELCLADLSNGGRGIRNQVEAHLVNPLARVLFECSAGPGSRLTIAEVEADKITRLVERSGA